MFKKKKKKEKKEAPEERVEKKRAKKDEREVKFSTIVYSFASIVLAYVLIVWVCLYVFGIENPIIRKTAKFIPFPVAVIDGKTFVTSRDWISQADFVLAIYKQDQEAILESGARIDFSTPDGKKRLQIKEKELLNKIIENKIIGKLAEEKGVKTTMAMASQEVERKIDQYGDENFVKNKLQRYGWDIQDFEKNVVLPAMEKENLAGIFLSKDPTRLKALEKIKQAKNDLDDKKDFAGIAETYSDGESQKNGGYVGWFSAQEMLPEISVGVFAMKKGEVSEIVESALGFHIIKLENKKTEDGVEKVEIRQIFVRTKAFADWLLEQEKNMKIKVLLHDLRFDIENQEVTFAKKEMLDFESKNLEQEESEFGL